MNKAACVADLRAKPRESLETAREIEANEHHGFAASRAYYAMFYAAKAALLHAGLQFSKHSAVLAHFNSVFVKQGVFPRDIFKAFQKAFNLRTQGDYGVTPVAEEEAVRVIRDAEEFVRTIGEYLKAE